MSIYFLFLLYFFQSSQCPFKFVISNYSLMPLACHCCPALPPCTTAHATAARLCHACHSHDCRLPLALMPLACTATLEYHSCYSHVTVMLFACNMLFACYSCYSHVTALPRMPLACNIALHCAACRYRPALPRMPLPPCTATRTAADGAVTHN